MVSPILSVTQEENVKVSPLLQESGTCKSPTGELTPLIAFSITGGVKKSFFRGKTTFLGSEKPSSHHYWLRPYELWRQTELSSTTVTARTIRYSMVPIWVPVVGTPCSVWPTSFAARIHALPSSQ